MRAAAMLAIAVALIVAAPRPPAWASAPPRVVASIVPVHALVAGVMAGIATPRLLVRGSGSPHHTQMRPSAAAALDQAEIVFWIGEPLETFLVRPLAALGDDVHRVALIEAPGLRLLAVRGAAALDDPHIWLSPDNAKAMVGAIAAALSGRDPGRAAAYGANRDRMMARIQRLARAMESAFAAVRDVPFVVFHDSFRYLEDHFALRAVGAIINSAEQPPGARSLRALRAVMRAQGVACVFGELQSEAPLIATVIEGTDARRADLDALGRTLEPGPDAYFRLMSALAETMRDCLSRR